MSPMFAMSYMMSPFGKGITPEQFEASVWRDGPRPWELGAGKGPFEVGSARRFSGLCASSLRSRGS